MMNRLGTLLFVLLLIGPVAGDAAASVPALAHHNAVCTRVDGRGDYVVLVHGLSWYRDANRAARMFFAARGYSVVAFGYDSRKAASLSDVTSALREGVAANCIDPRRRIHFLGHSMGAIIIRKFLDESPPPRLGRVVFMGCPNHGTSLADALTHSSALRLIFGPAAAELGTGRDSVPSSLGPAPYGPGIIMAGRSMFPFLSPFVPGRDDGVVAVDSGRLEGMADFRVLRTTHTFLPRCERALHEADLFFRTGQFSATTGVVHSPERGKARLRWRRPSDRRSNE
jgi:pimeloyl-ACP methyl ester carboxylesterase